MSLRTSKSYVRSHKRTILNIPKPFLTYFLYLRLYTRAQSYRYISASREPPGAFWGFGINSSPYFRVNISESEPPEYFNPHRFLGFRFGEKGEKSQRRHFINSRGAPGCFDGTQLPYYGTHLTNTFTTR